jgi:hypothetical protein
LTVVHPPQVMMPTANSPSSKEVVTAALLVIGGKILSGPHQGPERYIAEYLTALGIDLKEVRVTRRERSSTRSTLLHRRRDRADPR